MTKAQRVWLSVGVTALSVVGYSAFAIGFFMFGGGLFSGQSGTETHTVDSWTVTTEPTETTEGEAEGVCTECGETVTVPLPALSEADYTVTTVEPTCTESGSATYVYYNEENDFSLTFTVTLDALGHSWGEWVETQKGNCVEQGEETHTCEVCGETETRETGYGLHSFSADWDAVNDQLPAIGETAVIWVTVTCANEVDTVFEEMEAHVAVKEYTDTTITYHAYYIYEGVYYTEDFTIDR